MIANHGAPPGGFLVLVADDDPQLRRYLRMTLRTMGCRIAEASTGAEALAFARGRRPDLVVLDLGLPDLDGHDVIARLRAWLTSPILVLSGRHAEEDKVRALDLGADDYVTKPFNTNELLARVRAALRRSVQIGKLPEAGVFTSGQIRIDRDRHEVTVRGQPVRLTPLEYRLLDKLLRHVGKVVTQGQLLRDIWGEAHVNEPHYLRVYMSALRRKLELDPAHPRLLLTEQGVGYRLADGSQGA